MRYQAVIYDSHINRWRAFCSPTEILQTNEVSQVKPLLQQIERKVKSGLWALGFVSYEAAPAFESSAEVKADPNFPKIWFALYSESLLIDLPKSNNNFYLAPWRAEIEHADYLTALAKIKQYIKRGDSYQANFTYRQEAIFQGDAFDCFLAFIERQPTKYAAFIDCQNFCICSASPELFFIKDGSDIIAKPMKGTAPRGKDSSEDLAFSLTLSTSSKERAENVMIVDMIRNDLSRIARNDSVKARSLFDTEDFETLWQMTSTIEAKSDRSVLEILEALFPCASITGAPKCSTMKILAELEKSPRRIYTGSIGLLAPGNSDQAQFNVAIRTIIIDKKKAQACYGVGSGIVWDCDPEKEFQECLLKSEATPNLGNKLELLETMLWQPQKGIYLLDQHLTRLENSAAFFGYICEREKIQKYLEETSKAWRKKDQKIRLLLGLNGKFQVEVQDLSPKKDPLNLALAKFPVNSKNIYLLHKTTIRRIYNDALAQNPGFDDVLLWNENNEITETCIGNIVFQLRDIWYTPPVSCGLLNGVYRQSLLNDRTLCERALLVSELGLVDQIAVVNSVRGWVGALIKT